MHDQQPVLDLFPVCPRFARHWPSSTTSLPSYFVSLPNWVTLAFAIFAFFFGNIGTAAESLWLDVARSSITTGELRNHVGVLADDMLEGREAGSRGGLAAAKYIIARLQEAQLQPAGPNGGFKQSFLHGHQNLLAVLPGSDPELRDEYLVIGAHYDHVGYGSRRNSYGPWGYIHNGADDNASGVATLLEIIDALSQSEHRPRRSILFAFWDGEEKGLLGSKHWVAQPTVPVEAIKLAINIDMVGRMTDGRIEVGGTRMAAGLRRLLCSSGLGEETWLDFSWEYKDNSDHWTFCEAGIPSIYFHTGLHEDYHRPSDDVEKLNIEGMRQVSTYLLERLDQLANAERLPGFRTQGHQETPATQRQVERRLPVIAPRLDFAWKYVASVPAVVVVEQVPWNSMAMQAGLVVGDRIVGVQGESITSEAMLPAVALQSDQTVELQVERAGEDQPVSVVLSLVGSPTRLGLSWRTDAAEPQSVYVTRVVPYSPADLAGIKLYDRLYAFNGKPISGADELLVQVQTLLDAGAETLQFELESRGSLREIVLPLGPPTAPLGDATL